MLAELTGVKGSVMMLAHGNMRVSHVSTHVALEAFRSGQPERGSPSSTSPTLARPRRRRARIAVAALNPHAGEGGLFGRQDIDYRAHDRARPRRGLDVVGPGRRTPCS